MCKPFYIEIVREIPLENKKSLLNTDKSELALIHEHILEYCKQPRTIEEIRREIGFDTTTDSIRRCILNPLMKIGRLKYFFEYKCHAGQRYINADIEVTKQMIARVKDEKNTLAREYKNKILKFCKTPKGIKEIEKHIHSKTALQYIRELIADNKLKLTHPDIPTYCQQRYFNAEFDYPQFTDQGVVEYCKEPRTKAEIEQHFNITNSLRKGVVERLLNQGKIDYTEDSKKLGKFDGQRRLISNGQFI